jgi:CRP-like cAMP-binding protein
MHVEVNGVLVPCQHTPSQNHLLASLSAAGYESLLPHLKMIRVRKNEVLSDPGKRPGLIYFPVDCVISIDHTLENGESTEIALIGNEGMYDITRVLGGVGMPYSASAQTTGHAFVIDGSHLKQELDRDESLQHTLLLYAQALFTQMAQGAVCNRHHSLSQHICPLLLLIHDKSLSGDLLLTQETIAHMLGVRREDVTKAAVKLRNGGLIDYRRGHITVLNRQALEEQCCECYLVVKNEFKRLLGY